MRLQPCVNKRQNRRRHRLCCSSPKGPSHPEVSSKFQNSKSAASGGAFLAVSKMVATVKCSFCSVLRHLQDDLKNSQNVCKSFTWVSQNVCEISNFAEPSKNFPRFICMAVEERILHRVREIIFNANISRKTETIEIHRVS